MKGALMVCGTTSDAGKSAIVTGLCRVLSRQGVSVAPFKAQNMSLNSYVTADGAEIGHAQGVQALAANAVPEAAMNPILLKPSDDRCSQVIVGGVPIGFMDAATYHEYKPKLFDVVMSSLAELRKRFDVVVCEGAGSPAEINLLDHDIVNLSVAEAAGMATIVVGDIERGGVFAALYGTVALLPESFRKLIGGFVINKFRGDPALLGEGMAELERRCGVPTLGVIPYLTNIGLDAEDSLALLDRPLPGHERDGSLDVAVVEFPHISNFTDCDALTLEPGVALRYVRHVSSVGKPDLVILPGTKATVADLEWFRAQGFEGTIKDCHSQGSVVLGICGGYQMLGHLIADDVESRRGFVSGLGMLDVSTTFQPAKITRRRAGTALERPVSGYEIHHGVTERGGTAQGWMLLDTREGQESEGARNMAGSIFGTNLHGLFEQDDFRRSFLSAVASQRNLVFEPSTASFTAEREAQFDRLADVLEAHLDMDAVAALIGQAVAP